MALYIPVSRRRRNAALVAIATLIAGLIVGFLTGRLTAVTASEAASEVRAKGNTLGTRIEALAIEYDQAISGTGDSVQGGVLDALDLIDGDLDTLLEESPWLGAAQAAAVHTATMTVRTAAAERVDVDQFADIVHSAATTVRSTFGVDT